MSKQLYTTAQVAEMMAKSVEGVIDLIRSGQLAAIDVSLHPGGKPRYRIAAEDLEDFLRRRRTQPRAPAPKRRKRPTEVTQYY